MLYASCKESVTETIEKKFGITFDKKVRIRQLVIFFTVIILVGTL